MTGISGTGAVAEGVQFSDGTVVLRWLDESVRSRESRARRPADHCHSQNIGSVLALHGHGGATKVVWIDEKQSDGMHRQVRPFPNPTELTCDLEAGHGNSHHGVVRDYARPGSRTGISWKRVTGGTSAVTGHPAASLTAYFP